MSKKLNEFKKIALYGDSVCMPRPEIVRSDERYFYFLKRYFSSKGEDLETIEKAKASIPVTDLNEWVNHDMVYYPEKGDVFILHCGVVDCAPRPIAQETRDKVSAMPAFIKKRVIKFIHANRSKMIARHGGYKVTDINVFENQYTEILEKAVKQYNKVFLVNICPTDEKTEQHSPGFLQSIIDYNKVIASCAKKFNDSQVFLIDVFSLVDRKDIFKYITADGHHITPLTHQLIFSEIRAKL